MRAGPRASSRGLSFQTLALETIQGGFKITKGFFQFFYTLIIIFNRMEIRVSFPLSPGIAG